MKKKVEKGVRQSKEKGREDNKKITEENGRIKKDQRERDNHLHLGSLFMTNCIILQVIYQNLHLFGTNKNLTISKAAAAVNLSGTTWWI